MAVINSSEIVGSAENAPKRGMVLPFQPLSLAFEHVNYFVDMPAVSRSFTNTPFSSVYRHDCILNIFNSLL